MAFEVAGADAYSSDAVLIEVVGIHAAAALFEEGVSADSFCCCLGELAGAGAFIQAEGMVEGLEIDFDGRIVFLGNLFRRRMNVCGNLFVFRCVSAALLAGDGDQVADHIGGAAGGNDGEVGRGLRRQAAIGEMEDQVSSHFQSVETFFRFVAGVSGDAVNGDDHLALARSGQDDGAGAAGSVIDEAALGKELGEIILRRAFDAGFFANGESYFDGTVGNFFLLHFAKHGEDGGHAADVIARKNGGAVGNNFPFLLFHNGNDVAVISYAVHVGREEHRLAVRISRKQAIHIARISAEHVAGFVFLHDEAQVGELCL